MRVLFAGLLSLITLPAFAAGDWSGTWDTRWRDGGARLELRQDGGRVEGGYSSLNGTVEGTVAGKVFSGRWHQGSRSGGFDFVLSSDAKSFVGRYDTGEWWTGGRAATDPKRGDSVDLSTPRAAIRTFLRGGNTARYDAPDEMANSVAAVDFGASDLPPEVKLARARTLFDLIDATTFRVFTIPDAVQGDHVTVTLTQAGTDAEMPVQFTKTGNGWGIVMPDEATLAAMGKSLFARAGGHPPAPDDYRLRRSARDAYRTFTRAFFDWDRGGRAQALSALDLSAVSEAIRDYQGNLAAQYLNGILDRVGLPEPEEVPDDPNATRPYVLFSHPAGQVVIAPVGTDKPATWGFTRETVRHARDLFVVVEDLPAIQGRTLPTPQSAFFALRRHVRDAAPSLMTDVGPLEAWQVVGWIGVLALSLGLGLLLTELAMRISLRLVGTHDARADRRALRFAVWGAVTFSVYKLIIPAIGLSDEVKQFSVGATGILLVVSLMFLGWVAVDALGERLFGTREGKQVTMDNIVVSLLFGFLKLGLVVVGLTLIAVELSLPYEGIVASLSIGGLAVAFASRETLSNVFGAGVLAIDRPFKRGDFISAGGVEGTVEHVGIRSTRVRTSDDSLVIVPNGKLSDSFVNNLGSRRYHLGSLKLPLPYATTVAQIEALMKGVRGILDGVPQLAPERTTLALTTIGTDGIQISIGYSIDAGRGGDETAIVNRLVLDVLGLCERLEVRASSMPRVAAE